jgi:hypothetical protein
MQLRGIFIAAVLVSAAMELAVLGPALANEAGGYGCTVAMLDGLYAFSATGSMPASGPQPKASRAGGHRARTQRPRSPGEELLREE